MDIILQNIQKNTSTKFTLHQKRTLHLLGVAFKVSVEWYYLPHQTNS